MKDVYILIYYSTNYRARHFLTNFLFHNHPLPSDLVIPFRRYRMSSFILSFSCFSSASGKYGKSIKFIVLHTISSSVNLHQNVIAIIRNFESNINTYFVHCRRIVHDHCENEIVQKPSFYLENLCKQNEHLQVNIFPQDVTVVQSCNIHLVDYKQNILNLIPYSQRNLYW